MSKYHNTYQRIYQEKYIFLDTVTQPYVVLRNVNGDGIVNILNFTRIAQNFRNSP